MGSVVDSVDVIAEFKSDGSIIPMRFRILNEDGEYEQYTIRGVRQIPVEGTHTTIDGLYVCVSDLVFECKVVVGSMERLFRLYYFYGKSQWRLALP